MEHFSKIHNKSLWNPKWLIEVFEERRTRGCLKVPTNDRMMALIYACVINARVLGTDYDLEEAV